MRLHVLENGHDRVSSLTLRLVRLLSGNEVPDVVKVTTYRHRYFGTPFTNLVQDLMRGPSQWSVGERELFAAFTSSRNRCPFCISVHQDFAGAYQDPDLVAAALEDPVLASRLPPQVAATLVFLDRLAADPDAVTREDVEHVRAAGVNAQALDEAVRISVLFHVINRVMDTAGAAPLQGRPLTVARRLVGWTGYRNPPTVRYLSRSG